MGQTVTVGCKLPNGLILEVAGKAIQINGANSSRIIGGYGLTEGIDKDFFDAWLKQNAGLSFVKNGMVFAQSKSTDAIAEATEKAEVKTGLEPKSAEDAKAAGVEIDTKE